MNQAERDKLILDNLGLIYKCISNLCKLYLTDDEFESLYYHGLCGLMEGIDTYDKSKSASSTYYYTCTKNKIILYLRSKNLHKQKINYIKKYSLDSNVRKDCDILLQDVIPSREKIDDHIENKIQIEKIIIFLEEQYSKTDVLIFKMYFGLCGFAQMSAKELAEVFFTTPKDIDSKIKKMKQRIKNHKKKFG